MPLAELENGTLQPVEIDLSPLNPPVADVTASVQKADAAISSFGGKPQTLEEIVRRLVCITAAFADEATFHSKIRELAADAVPVLAMARARKAAMP